MKSNWKSLPVLFGFVLWASCQPESLGSAKPISVRTLADEYERSRSTLRSKYDGKEIIVSGYAMIAPTPPTDDQGSVQLEEKYQPARKVVCWFSKDQAEQFSTIKSGQFITVKGIFNGEAGADLRFCKLVKFE